MSKNLKEMKDYDVREILPLLQSLGVSPDMLGPSKLEKIAALASEISDPSKITPEVAHKIMETLGIKIGGPVKDRTKIKKVGRNEKCPCGSGKKHKKCCGK